MDQVWWREWAKQGGREDALTEGQLAELEARRKEHERRLVAAVHDLAGTEHGTEFLRWVMAQCRVFEQECSNNDKWQAFVSGRREFGLKVFALCVRDGCASAVVDDLREVDIDI